MMKKMNTVELSVNLDDMTPEEIGYAMEILLRNGALDVFTIPIGMKKNRPGTMLSCIVYAEDEERIAGLMLKHTTSIGVRVVPLQRYVMEKECSVKETSLGSISIKKSTGFGVEKTKPEFDDLKRIADDKNLSLFEVKKMIEID